MRSWVPIASVVLAAPCLAIAVSCGSNVDADAGQDAQAGDAAQPSLDASSEGSPEAAVGCAVARGPTCSASLQSFVWREMLTAPVIPPYGAVGLDLRGAADAGLTLAQAESRNCQGDVQGDLFGDGTCVATWGDNAEVWLRYEPVTGIALSIALYQGALGEVHLKSPDGTSTYSIPLSRQILKNMGAFTLDTGWSGAGFEAEVDELYRALVATYAPMTALDPPGTTCVSTRKCVVGSFGARGSVSMPDLGFAFAVTDRTAAQPAPSTPSQLSVGLAM